MWLSPGLPGVILWSGGVAALQAGECQLATSARRVCGGCRPRRRSRQGVCASKAFVRMLRTLRVQPAWQSNDGGLSKSKLLLP